MSSQIYGSTVLPSSDEVLTVGSFGSHEEESGFWSKPRLLLPEGRASPSTLLVDRLFTCVLVVTLSLMVVVDPAWVSSAKADCANAIAIA